MTSPAATPEPSMAAAKTSAATPEPTKTQATLENNDKKPSPVEKEHDVAALNKLIAQGTVSRHALPALLEVAETAKVTQR